MSGGKQTPRQKMIGMMYLVLTALLALNISKEIINAFITIDDGLKLTNANFDKKNEMTYMAFAKAYDLDKVKAKVPYENAMKAKNCQPIFVPISLELGVKWLGFLLVLRVHQRLETHYD